MARGEGLADPASRRWRYAARGAALAASTLSLAPGYSGILLLTAAGGAAFVWATRAAGGRAAIRSRLNQSFAERFQPHDRLALLRWFVAGCQAITIAITWRLWQPREYPPLLPLVELPPIDFGPLLLVSLVLVLAFPSFGIWAHLATLAVALVGDQTRLQPELVSLALLLVATNQTGWGRFVGRAHLASMWAWAGVHKLLSTDFLIGSAPWMYEGLPVELPWMEAWFGWVVAGTELATGLLVLVPALRRPGVILALGLHGMILLVLSPWGHDWNESVWPWNLALGPAALVLFWPWKQDPATALGRERILKLAVGGVAALYPLGFYFGVSDTYLSHHLYSDAQSRAYCEPVGSCRSANFTDTWTAMAVPLPPEPRLYRRYFAAQCTRGETLVVLPRRTRIFQEPNAEPVRYRCPVRDHRARADAARAAEPRRRASLLPASPASASRVLRRNVSGPPVSPDLRREDHSGDHR